MIATNRTHPGLLQTVKNTWDAESMSILADWHEEQGHEERTSHWRQMAEFVTILDECLDLMDDKYYSKLHHPRGLLCSTTRELPKSMMLAVSLDRQLSPLWIRIYSVWQDSKYVLAQARIAWLPNVRRWRPRKFGCLRYKASRLFKTGIGVVPPGMMQELFSA